MTPPLRDLFLRQLAPPARRAFEGQASLEETLQSLVTRARETYPMPDVDDESFVAFVATHVTADTALQSLHAGDLLLAFGCLLGDPEATALFEREVINRVATVTKGTLPPGLTADEVLQRLRVRLLVRQGERPPALATYSGRGMLVHWCRAATARLIQEEARAQRARPVDDEALVDVPALSRDLDVALLKHQYAAAFKEAFSAALAELSPKEQNLLRLHYLEGMRAEEIGRVFDTHRTTVWRWLTQVRETLLAKTRDQLASRVPLAELSSLMNVVHSQLDVSLSRILKK